MSNEKLENKDNNNNNFFEIEEKKTEKKIIDDDDEPYQIKYDRVVQKVKRVSLEDVIKFRQDDAICWYYLGCCTAEAAAGKACCR